MSVILAALLAAAPQAGLPPCDGAYATIRTSTIKPGKWAQFQKAVADHAAWYAAKKSKGMVKLARVIERGGAYSTTEAVTITTYGREQQPQRDAAYSAFVAAYQASSDLKNEARVCLPRL